MASASAVPVAAAAGGAGLETPAAVSDFLKYVDASPSPFHSTAGIADQLEEAGFEKLSERTVWEGVRPGGKYYVTRNQTAVIAFTVGGKWDPSSMKSGFTIAGAHTDSPCLRVRPKSHKEKSGVTCVGVEAYGGLICHTWFDRDLGVAGRVLVQEDEESPKLSSKLININRALLRVPTCAIHLQRDVNSKFAVDKEQHLWTVLSTEVERGLDGPAAAGAGPATSRHGKLLMQQVAAALGPDVKPEQVKDFELSLYDCQPSSVGGAGGEFIFAPRLDNLLMCFCATQALVQASQAEGALDDDTHIRVVGLFDNEEVGSASGPGAAGSFLEDVLKRLVGSERLWPVVVRNSLLVSADMAHATHPNYADKHSVQIRMNEGVVIKHNANQRYATNAVVASMMRRAADMEGVPVQEYVHKQSIGCGSTIGPILATRLGIRTVDVGVAQLSMHSAREMCGSADVERAIRLMRRTFEAYPAIDQEMAETD